MRYAVRIAEFSESSDL